MAPSARAPAPAPAPRPAESDRAGDLRWSIIAATSREEAERYVSVRGLRSVALHSKADVLADPQGFWRELRQRQVDVLAVHSRAWPRQRSAQFFEAVLALAPVSRRLIIDGESGAERELNGRQLALHLARAPAEVARGLGIVGREVRAFQSAQRWSEAAARSAASGRGTDVGVAAQRRAGGGAGDSVLAIWHGLQVGAVGGAATHIAGILAGFRALGLRIALVTTEPPPPQLTPLLDELVVIAPLPRGARVNVDTEELAMNRRLEQAASALAQRLRPAFIYQRHRQFLWAGAEVARDCGVPLVLEFNNSEAWVRQHHYGGVRLGRLLNPTVAGIERYVLAHAELTAAVSDLVAEQAVAWGADPARVAVVPNGVDVDEISELVDESGGPAPGQAPLIGWVGAFCQWHGTEVLVRAIPHLGSDARLLLIGDGERRAACEAIAQELGVADRVQLPGALPHDEVIRRLARCDVVASPHVDMPNQRFFGSPTKLFEYMAIGRPIVASRLEQLGDVLEDGVTARLVTPGDELELAEAITQVLDSEDRGQKLALAARRVADGHGWDDRARSIVDRLHIAPRVVNVPASG
jgi:glycosyltransferase involved in cell wall biosynthesis